MYHLRVVIISRPPSLSLPVLKRVKYGQYTNNGEYSSLITEHYYGLETFQISFTDIHKSYNLQVIGYIIEVYKSHHLYIVVIWGTYLFRVDELVRR